MADGFSIAADDYNNITLLKWNKSIAWFSVAVSEETLREFIKLVKDCEKRHEASVCENRG